MKFVCSILYFMFMKTLNERMLEYRRAKDTEGNDIYGAQLFPLKICQQWFDPVKLKKKKSKTDQRLYDEHKELILTLREKLNEWIDSLHDLMV